MLGANPFAASTNTHTPTHRACVSSFGGTTTTWPTTDHLWGARAWRDTRHLLQRFVETEARHCYLCTCSISLQPLQGRQESVSQSPSTRRRLGQDVVAGQVMIDWQWRIEMALRKGRTLEKAVRRFLPFGSQVPRFPSLPALPSDSDTLLPCHACLNLAVCLTDWGRDSTCSCQGCVYQNGPSPCLGQSPSITSLFRRTLPSCHCHPWIGLLVVVSATNAIHPSGTSGTSLMPVALQPLCRLKLA